MLYNKPRPHKLLLNAIDYHVLCSGRLRGGARAPPFGKVKKKKWAPFTEDCVLRARKRNSAVLPPPPPIESRRLCEAFLDHDKFLLLPPPTPTESHRVLGTTEKFRYYPPPPTESHRVLVITGKSCYYPPPPTESRGHGTSHESGPPP